MKRKGIVAILDSLAGYLVAFTAIGLLALLMSNSQEPEIKTAQVLNVWAEDIADIIGNSMVDPEDYSKKAWFDNTDAAIIAEIKNSLDNIATNKGLEMEVTIQGTTFYETGNLANSDEVVTATRYLRNYVIKDVSIDLVGTDLVYVPDGTLSKLTIKVGI
jgi:hypothetical protein